MTPLRETLRRADDMVVPYAAQRLRAVLNRRSGGPSAHGGAGHGVGGRLRRLDDRYAGPRMPLLAGLALAAVLLTGTAVLLTGGPDGPGGLRGLPGLGGAGRGALPSAPGRTVLGPEVGTPVEAYLTAARERAVQRSRERPEALHVALVTFEGYARPRQAAAALGDLEVLRAYLRVPGEQPSELLAAGVGDLAPDLEALYRATAGRKAEDARELRALADSLGGTPQAEAHREQARLAAREARAYGSGCGCLFAVVVRATAATLAPLPNLEGFRAVDPAPRGVPLEEVDVRVLRPEDDDVVTPLPGTTTAAPAGAGPGAGG